MGSGSSEHTSLRQNHRDPLPLLRVVLQSTLHQLHLLLPAVRPHSSPCRFRSQPIPVPQVPIQHPLHQQHKVPRPLQRVVLQSTLHHLRTNWCPYSWTCVDSRRLRTFRTCPRANCTTWPGTHSTASRVPTTRAQCIWTICFHREPIWHSMPKARCWSAQGSAVQSSTSSRTSGIRTEVVALARTSSLLE